MRAEVHSVDACPGFAQAFVDPEMKRSELLFRVVPARDSGLVRDDYREVAGVVQIADGFSRAGDPLEVLGSTYVAMIDVEYAITV